MEYKKKLWELLVKLDEIKDGHEYLVINDPDNLERALWWNTRVDVVNEIHKLQGEYFRSTGQRL